MVKNQETRILSNVEAQLRALEDNNKRIIEGYAAVFNKRSKLLFENGEFFFEIIERGAFDNVLKNESINVILNFNHNRDNLLARTVSKTLSLSVDDYGLKYRASLPNTSLGNDVYQQVMRGDLYENSFAFSVARNGEIKSIDKEGNKIRTITNIGGLYDTAIVTDGAYADTKIALRSWEEFEQNQSNSQTDDEYIKQILLRNKLQKDRITILKLKSK